MDRPSSRLHRFPALALVAGFSLGSHAVLLAGEPSSSWVGWWKGENNAVDSVGTNDGTLVGGVGFEAGVAGNAFSFDAFDDYVQLPASAAPSGDFTVSTWVRFTSLSKPPGSPSTFDDMTIIGDMSTSLTNGPGWRLLKQTDGSIWLLAGAGSASVKTGALSAGQWYHVAVSIENRGLANETHRLYLDGVLSASAVGATFHGSINPVPNFLIGAYTQPSFMYGNIDDVRLYDRALTDEEVASLHGDVVDPGSSLFLPGTTLHGTISDPLDQDILTFDALKGTKLKLRASATTGPTMKAKLIDPQGKKVKSFVLGSDKFQNVKLAKTGTYSLRLSAKNEATGEYTIETAGSLPKGASSNSKTLKGKAMKLSLLALPGATLDATLTPLAEFDPAPTVTFTLPDQSDFDLASFSSLGGDDSLTLTGVPLTQLGKFVLKITNAPSAGSKVGLTWTLTQPPGAKLLEVE